MELYPLLRQIGLKEKEISVFLTGTTLGLQPASIIADKAKINRITAYVTLKKLVLKGLAKACSKKGIQYFQVSEPKKLLTYAAQKQDEWKNLHQKLERAVDVFEMPYIKNYNPMEVLSFQGYEGVKALLKEVLEAKRIIMISKMRVDSHVYFNYLHDFFFGTIEKYNIETDFFFEKNNSAKTLKERFTGAGLQNVHILNTIPFDVDTYIFDHKNVAFVAYQNDVISGAIIESEALAKNLEMFFPQVFLEKK